MNSRNATIFAYGHIVIPLILAFLYLSDTSQPIILALFVLNALWTCYLIWRLNGPKDLYRSLHSNRVWSYIVVDSIFLALIFAFPEWSLALQPTWLVLFILFFYALDVGMGASLLFSLSGLINMFLYSVIQHVPFTSISTLLICLGILILNFIFARLTDQVRIMSSVDPLTMLPNRFSFRETLDQLILHNKQPKKSIAVFFLDLDQFKYINDTMGHEAGDTLLKGVAKRLQSILPKKATLARMGGDEFAIVLTEDANDAADIAETIKNSLKKSLLLKNKEIFITFGVGISLYPPDGHDAETLMKNADSALYLAKEQGRNNVQFYTPPSTPEKFERITMETMLRHAVDKKEFVVYYQPRVDTTSGQTICLEALVRWNHPEQGLIPPGDFIPLAEETGLIREIGEQVLSMACKQLKEWQNKGYPPMSVSVNLSARQFIQTDLPEMIAKVLKSTKLNARFLEFEITESAAMYDVEYAIVMIKVLKEMGLKIVIDDFGTGYSSLSYLKKFPINGLKIDRSFISGIHHDSDDAAIVTAIILLAKALNLQVTGEGVETAEQFQFLQEKECDEAQGYYFGKPMPSHIIEEWMDHENQQQIDEATAHVGK